MPRDLASRPPLGPPMPLRHPRKVQVTRSARILFALSAAFFSIALVAVFVLGGIALSRGLAEIGLLRFYPVAAVAYAVVFGIGCAKARV